MWELSACIHWGIKLRDEYSDISLDWLSNCQSGSSSMACEEMQEYSEQGLGAVGAGKKSQCQVQSKAHGN